MSVLVHLQVELPPQGSHCKWTDNQSEMLFSAPRVPIHKETHLTSLRRLMDLCYSRFKWIWGDFSFQVASMASKISHKSVLSMRNLLATFSFCFLELLELDCTYCTYWIVSTKSTYITWTLCVLPGLTTLKSSQFTSVKVTHRRTHLLHGSSRRAVVSAEYRCQSILCVFIVIYVIVDELR